MHCKNPGCTRTLRPTRSELLAPHEEGYCYSCRYNAFTRQERALSRTARTAALTTVAAQERALNPTLRSDAVRAERILTHGQIDSIAYLMTDRAFYFAHASIGEGGTQVHRARLHAG